LRRTIPAQPMVCHDLFWPDRSLCHTSSQSSALPPSAAALPLEPPPPPAPADASAAGEGLPGCCTVMSGAPPAVEDSCCRRSSRSCSWPAAAEAGNTAAAQAAAEAPTVAGSIVVLLMTAPGQWRRVWQSNQGHHCTAARRNACLRNNQHLICSPQSQPHPHASAQKKPMASDGSMAANGIRRGRLQWKVSQS
jgi:hypothetical protein